MADTLTLPLPAPPVTTLTLPEAPTLFIDAGSIPRVDPPRPVFPSGVGSLTAAAIAAVRYGVDTAGSGTLAVTVLAIGRASAAFTGSGTASAAANEKNQWPIDEFNNTGDGQLSAAVALGLPATADLTGSGGLSAAVSIALGSIGFTGSGDTSVDAVQSTVPMGMDKVGSTGTLANGAWSKVTGWAARSGFPDTVIVDDTLVVKSQGVYRVNAHEIRSSSQASNQTRVARLSNGVTSYVATAANASTAVTDIEVPAIMLLPGDRLWLEVFASTVSSGPRTVVSGTYLVFDRAVIPTGPAVGIRKVGTQQLPTSTTMTTPVELVGWEPDPAFPGSVVTSEGITVPYSGAIHVELTGSLTFAGGTAHSRGIAMYADGIQIATDPPNTAAHSRTDFAIAGDYTARAGQLLTMRVWSNATNVGNRDVTAATISVHPATIVT